jgi:CubicO group peptidase (beta-lactamase class C family)
MPGERYKYNGFLFTFLSKVAEKASGKAFDELFGEKMIAPLEMTRTVPSINEELRNQTLTYRVKYYGIGSSGSKFSK